MTPTNDVSLDIQRKVQTAISTAQTSAPSTLDKIHHSQDLDPPSPTLWQQNVVLTTRDENQLLVFERKVFPTICGPIIENDVYTRRYNHELDKEFDSPNALNVTKTSR
jgi:hypothetical protein